MYNTRSCKVKSTEFRASVSVMKLHTSLTIPSAYTSLLPVWLVKGGASELHGNQEPMGIDFTMTDNYLTNHHNVPDL